MVIRALTYNVHKCIGGLDRRYDLERVVETIAHYDPDIALLQEVDRGAKRSKGDDQAVMLAEALGFSHRCWFSNVKVRSGGEYGNAILSKFPIVSSENIDITIGPKKRRSVLHTNLRVSLPSGSTRTLHVYNAHLGLSGIERNMQLRRFLASNPFSGLHHDTPVIIGGDFNDVWGTLGKKIMFPAGFQGQKISATFPAYAPVRALDSLYVRGDLTISKIQPGRTKLCKQASDHLPLIAELELQSN